MPSYKKSNQTSRKIIPEQVNFSPNSPVYIPFFLADKTAKIQAVWELELANGERDAGKVKRHRLQFDHLPIGNHKLTVIIGTPLLSKGTKIYHCNLNIKAD